MGRREGAVRSRGARRGASAARCCPANPPPASPHAGPIVCACFGVGLNTLREAIHSGAAISVEAIGQALRAGTNCGSCLPELRKLVAEPRAALPA